MAEHTPTPWRIVAGDDYYITANGYPAEFMGRFKGDDNGGYLAIVGNRPRDFGDANAKFIIKAVNNHQALVEALQAVDSEIVLTGQLKELVDATLASVSGSTDGGNG